MKPKTIFVGGLQTRNYEFASYGLTFDEAYKTLKKGWNKWRKASGATYTWKELWEGGDAWVSAVDIGVPYMDREPMKW